MTHTAFLLGVLIGVVISAIAMVSAFQIAGLI